MVVLPNQLSEENNKADFTLYGTSPDGSSQLLQKEKEMRLGENLSKDEVRAQVLNPLTRRELLSQVSGLYDPLGLVTPFKQKGAILVRRAFQEAKVKFSPSENTWRASDKTLSASLKTMLNLTS